MYAPSAAPLSYFEVSGGAQVTVAGSSPSAVPSHSMVGITMDVGQSHRLQRGSALSTGMDGTRHTLAHTSRSPPATVAAHPGSGGAG